MQLKLNGKVQLTTETVQIFKQTKAGYHEANYVQNIDYIQHIHRNFTLLVFNLVQIRFGVLLF